MILRLEIVLHAYFAVPVPVYTNIPQGAVILEVKADDKQQNHEFPRIMVDQFSGRLVFTFYPLEGWRRHVAVLTLQTVHCENAEY